jgi:isocitrate/isopropylmalate dehydrogenase
LPGANIGDDCAVFEAVHGRAPDIAGKGAASPTALILSGVERLDYLGEQGAARRLYEALRKVILEGKHVTRDLGGSAGTHAYAEALIKALFREGSVVCPMTPPFSRPASYSISNRRREFPSPSYRRT